MSATRPRAAYCTGCDTLFEKHHLLIRHRRLEKCGGRFLPGDEREQILAAKNIRLYADAWASDPQDRTGYMLFAQGHLKVAKELRDARRKK